MVRNSRVLLRSAVTLSLLSSVPSAFAILITGDSTPLTQMVTVQPIIVSDDDGDNTAEFFGSSSQRSDIEGSIDQIWAQAGIDVDFLNPNSVNSTFINEGDSSSRPESDLAETVSIGTSVGVTNTNPDVINMFFVNVAAGFTLLSEDTAAGLASTPGNSVSQYVGSNLLNFSNGRDVIASVVAHEIGHNLGLEHATIELNLMQAGNTDPAREGERLNSEQIAIALASNFSVDINATNPINPTRRSTARSCLAVRFGTAWSGWRQTQKKRLA